MVIVLGARGTGKTTEFRVEAAALEKSGKNGFFLPLYRITDREQSRLVFGSLGQRLDRWRTSSAHAYMCLDSQPPLTALINLAAGLGIKPEMLVALTIGPLRREAQP